MRTKGRTCLAALRKFHVEKEVLSRDVNNPIFSWNKEEESGVCEREIIFSPSTIRVLVNFIVKIHLNKPFEKLHKSLTQKFSGINKNYATHKF